MKVDEIPSFKDIRGSLIPVYFEKLPFKPKRIFTVSEVPKGMWRGGHAHKQNEQYLVCVQGSITVTQYDGKGTETAELSPGQGVLVKRMMWDSQRFNTGNDVLLVLCAMPYVADDYIRDREEFNREIEKRKGNTTNYVPRAYPN